MTDKVDLLFAAAGKLAEGYDAARGGWVGRAGGFLPAACLEDYLRACGKLDQVLGGWEDLESLVRLAKEALVDEGLLLELTGMLLLAGDSVGADAEGDIYLERDPLYQWAVQETGWAPDAKKFTGAASTRASVLGQLAELGLVPPVD